MVVLVPVAPVALLPFCFEELVAHLPAAVVVARLLLLLCLAAAAALLVVGAVVPPVAPQPQSYWFFLALVALQLIVCEEMKNYEVRQIGHL